MTTIRGRLAGALPALVIALSGCTAASPEPAPTTARAPSTSPSTAAAAPEPAPELVGWPGQRRRQGTYQRPAVRRAPVKRFTLTVPAIGIRSLEVVAYAGRPDDGPGTHIQDGGVAASPFGPRGGERLGEIGNLIVTAHRTSSTKAFRSLPALRTGERIEVGAHGLVYVYEATATRQTSFRSARSLAEQAAAVPGHPGRRPTQSVITLSTCATPEDRAAGNYWSDQYDNPEHRIDKIGVLVEIRSAT
ncbi:sortase domain-containing protein [Flindersiella endophytica]